MFGLAIGLWLGGAASIVLSGWYFYLMIGNHRAGYYWHVNLGAWFAIFLDKFWTDDGLTYRAKFFRWLFTALLFGGAFAGLIEIYGPLVPAK